MIHIIPEHDINQHQQETCCACGPFLWTPDEEMICVHNSYDGRELLEQGYHKGLLMNGIKSRDGELLYEADVIETIQGSKFVCINMFGLKTIMMSENKEPFDLEDYMSPNIWKIGNLFDNPSLRNLFRKW